jgi:hypothetical protein
LIRKEKIENIIRKKSNSLIKYRILITNILHTKTNISFIC